MIVRSITRCYFSAIAGSLFTLIFFGDSDVANAQKSCYWEVDLALMDIPAAILIEELSLVPISEVYFNKELTAARKQLAFRGPQPEFPMNIDDHHCIEGGDYFVAGFEPSLDMWLVGEVFDSAVSFEFFDANAMHRYPVPTSYDHGLHSACISDEGTLLVMSSYDIPEYFEYFEYRSEIFLLSADEAGQISIVLFLGSKDYSICDITFSGSNEVLFSAYAGRSKEDGMSYFSIKTP